MKEGGRKEGRKEGRREGGKGDRKKERKVKYFRWHDSGDVQDLDHLRRIYEVCKLTPDVQHWMPTREACTKDYIV